MRTIAASLAAGVTAIAVRSVAVPRPGSTIGSIPILTGPVTVAGGGGAVAPVTILTGPVGVARGGRTVRSVAILPGSIVAPVPRRGRAITSVTIFTSVVPAVPRTAVTGVLLAAREVTLEMTGTGRRRAVPLLRTGGATAGRFGAPAVVPVTG